MKNLENSKLAVAVRLGLALSAFAVAGSAFAQDATNGTATPDSAKKLETITVTGSRIRSVDVETAQPVINITQADIQKTGLTNVGDILQNMTIAGQPTFSKSAVLTSNTEEGGQYVNLYNLGENRVLVLVNGKRWMTSLAGYTDMSTIPASLIERIEILKDGASAIYGSDAIAGVVNIILKDHYQGAEVSGSIGQNQGGDGRQQSYSFTLGSTGPKSSIVFAATYNKTDPVWAKSRDITEYTYGPNHIEDGLSATGPWGRFKPADADTAIVPGTHYLNHTGSWNGVGVGQDATQLSNYHSPGNFPDDYYNPSQQMMAQLPTELKSVFTSGSYVFNDYVTFKATGMYSERDSSTQTAGYPLNSASQPTFPVYLSADSYYNPVPGQDEYFTRRIVEMPRVSDESAKSFHFDAGFEGAFQVGNYTWNWDAGFDYNKYDVDTKGTGNINLLNLKQALGPSFLNSAGVVQCGTPTAPIALSQCVPFNILGGPSASTPAALKYIDALEQSTLQSLTKDYTANITGGLFEMPGGAGTFSFAAGVEHRDVSGYSNPDELASAGYTTDLAAGATSGRYNTNEAYVEFNIPVLKDLPGAKELSFDVASRYSHYSNFGGTTNNKYSFEWVPFDDLKIRGTFAKGFRAPTLDDTFGGGSQSFDYYTDPCDVNFGSTANPTVAAACKAAGLPANFTQTDNAGKPVSGPDSQGTTPFNTGAGNAFLKPEHSTSRTAGLIYSPSYVSGLDFTLDFYKITVTNVITAISADYVLDQCYVFSVQSYCSQFSRDANGQVVGLNRGNANLGSLDTSGYTFGVHYRLPDFTFGKFAIGFDSNYLKNYTTTSEAGAPPQDYAGTYGFPRLRSNLSVDWQLGKWGATWTMRYYGAIRDACVFDGECNQPNYQGPSWPYGIGANRKGALTFNDAQARYELPWKANVAVGIRDIFDKHPTTIYTVNNSSTGLIDPTQDLGRYFYVQYNQKF